VQSATAHAIAVGALRYFLLKFTRNSVIAFDFKEALSFEGETGPYCQYSAVRANSIFRKAGDEALVSAKALLANSVSEPATAERINEIFQAENGDEIWSLVTLASRLDEIVELAKTTAEPAHVAKYAFSLARAFNLFYHRHRIIAEEDVIRRSVLLVVADTAREQLTRALGILGITVPERM
jgi:arginyl-tRNA synthetase